MKIIGIILALTLAAAGRAHTLVARVDRQGAVLGQTLDYTAQNGVEVYGIGYNTQFPEYGVGAVLPVYAKSGTAVYAGGYLASWPERGGVGRLFLQPWLVVTQRLGRTAWQVGGGWYTPLNGGSSAVFSNDSSVLYQVGAAQFGPAVTYWKQSGGTPALRWGPKLKLRLGGGYALSLAAYDFGNRQKDERVVLTRTF